MTQAIDFDYVGDEEALEEKVGTCCVCMSIYPTVPMHLPCGHILCSGCLDDLPFQGQKRRGIRTCPECRANFHQNQPHKDLTVGGLIDALLVYCPMSVNGCNWKGRRDKCQMHLKDCVFNPAVVPPWLLAESRASAKTSADEQALAQKRKEMKRIRTRFREAKTALQKIVTEKRGLQKEIDELEQKINPSSSGATSDTIPPLLLESSSSASPENPDIDSTLPHSMSYGLGKRPLESSPPETSCASAEEPACKRQRTSCSDDDADEDDDRLLNRFGSELTDSDSEEDGLSLRQRLYQKGGETRQLLTDMMTKDYG